MSESPPTPSPRRTPCPADRQRDAERTKARLLDAASEEFAAKGFAGARVQEIANRAGVDKQLISYYFGGKEGLYTEIVRSWQQREASFNQADVPLAEMTVRYLNQILADPRPTRLAFWDELNNRPDGAEDQAADDVARMRARKELGEIADELDEPSVILALNGMVTVAATMPHLVRRLYGVDPAHPDFARRYGEQLRRIVARLKP